MFINYFVVALRNLQRQLLYSLINISGLAIGIACSLVMFLFVYSEWSYDRHFKNSERIYKIGISFFNMGKFGVGPEVLGEYLPKEFEGVEAFTRIKAGDEVPIKVNDQFYNEYLFYTDSSFFNMFSYEFVEGDASTALKGPSDMVMTQSMANKYFGNESAVGKVVAVGKGNKQFIVTGVVKDDKRSSQFKSSLWLSNEGELRNDSAWTSAGVYNYVLLRENNDQRDLESALDRIIEKQIYPQGGAQGSFEDYKKNENSVRFHVYPMLDVHLKSTLLFEISPGGNESSMYVFAGISVFILLLASVNFINLTTARATRRAKEVGIRKAIGSGRGKLIVQFILESVVVSLFATIISLALAEIFLSAFEIVTGEQLVNTLWTSGWSILALFVFAILVGFLSGIYPAFYLTSFNPIKVLKGSVGVISGGQFRNFLVVFQFSISICLMICSAIILRQMDFMQTKDLGFNEENMVSIENVKSLGEQGEVFKNELSQLSGVLGASLHTGEPGSKAIISYYTYSTAEMKNDITISTYLGDPDFIDVMGFHIIEGRNFDRKLASDSSAVVINESAARALGLAKPIGAVINKDQHVIGVVRDFHWESLRNTIAPVVLLIGKDYHQLGFRIDAKSAKEFLLKAEAKWNQLVPGEPFKYHFLDDNFGALLKKEAVFGKAIGFFTTLALFISCLGLYGLSAFTAEQRTKEIGIRKVLGASASNIVSMLSRKFTFLICIAIFIALPVSLFAMTMWMEGFAYKAELQLLTFVIVIAIVFIIALLTVSFHSFRAAIINPADTLKYE